MTLHHALEMLGIGPGSTEQELTRAFRDRVKRYHPDSNPDRPEWSNTMMAQLNSAYETVRSYLDEHPTQYGLKERAERYRNRGGADRNASARSAGTASRRSSDNTSAASDHPRFYAAYQEPFNPAFLRAFSRATDILLDGVFQYYQYGLQNVHLRAEGNLRSRYRGALRRVRKALEQLEQITPNEQLNRHESERVTLTLRFAHAFFRSMQIDKFFTPSSGGFETKAYRHYRRGSELLDDIIGRSLFPTSLGMRNGNPSIAECAHGSEQELLTVVTQFQQSDWSPEAIVKLQLLSSIVELHSAGILQPE